jgi:hypothetical protein
MSRGGFTSNKALFRVIGGRRATVQTDEAYNAKANAIFFRGQTLAIVRHFFEISCQIGRLPSILGREFFRARVSHHAIPSFEHQIVSCVMSSGR